MPTSSVHAVQLNVRVSTPGTCNRVWFVSTPWPSESDRVNSTRRAQLENVSHRFHILFAFSLRFSYIVVHTRDRGRVFSWPDALQHLLLLVRSDDIVYPNPRRLALVWKNCRTVAAPVTSDRRSFRAVRAHARCRFQCFSVRATLISRGRIEFARLGDSRKPCANNPCENSSTDSRVSVSACCQYGIIREPTRISNLLPSRNAYRKTWKHRKVWGSCGGKRYLRFPKCNRTTHR
jgi:hypothetical protein